MNDLLVFAKNILLVFPMIIMLILAGLVSLKFNRFYYGEYTLFRMRQAAANNSHPSIRQGNVNVNVMVAVLCVVIIAGLNEVIANKIVILYLAGILLVVLAIWDLISLPSQIKRNRQWLNKLSPKDKATYAQYKNFIRQGVILVVTFFAYSFVALRFLP